MSISEDVMNLYRELMKKSEDLIILSSSESILHWDMETKMPAKGVELRSRQLALIERIEHKMMTDTKLGRLIDKIVNHPSFEMLNNVQARNVFLMKKAYDESTKLPEELVAETAKQSAIAINIWKKAKASGDYSLFKPELEKLFGLKKKAAEILMEVKRTKNPYDALLDVFEPRITSETISHIFSDMKIGLMDIIDRCESIRSEIPDLRIKVPIEDQRKIVGFLACFLGYDIFSKDARGRIDETEHPFTTGYYDDIRIATHYYEDRFLSSIYSILHEGGHAIYEQELPKEWMFQPIGSACSMGFHESQSRFVENMVGRSPEFLSFFLPRLKEMIPDLSSLELDDLILAVNRVTPSQIRVEADEVTYGLHIIIRFEMEQDLFDGRLTIAELPTVWNEKYGEYLRVFVQNDSEGVLQDTHWAGGSFGYFPSYALGNIYGGMLLEALQKDVPDWSNRIAEESFMEVKSWLRDHVYKYGNLYDPGDLIQIATGRKLSIEPFLKYLREKYSKLYNY